MQKKIISGVQQIGIGVRDVHEAWKWYRKMFKTDVPILDAVGSAELMLPYTGGQPQERHAILAINMQGGGGFEIWQYTQREQIDAKFEILAGDLGIYVAKVKCRDIKATYSFFEEQNIVVGSLVSAPDGSQHFFVRDPYGNVFQLVESTDWFSKGGNLTGGAYGAIVGVSDIDKSLEVYQGILGYDKVVYDETGCFEDFAGLAGGDGKFRRILLTHSEKRKGAFSKLLGSSYIELIQVLDRQPNKIYQDRFWGDPGFIHLCFDVSGMDEIQKECEEKGYPFTCDSSSNFEMGEAAGHFTYIEDPDGTLIEFVETYKIPIIKKLGWYLSLKKRNPEKSLPYLMLQALSLSRVKD